MKMIRTIAALAICAGIAVLASGCGGDASVVTVTQVQTTVETVAFAAGVPSQVTASDQRTATFVRDQVSEMNSLSNDISNGAFRKDRESLFLRTLTLSNASNSQSLVGVSPCMQEVKQQWGGINKRYLILLSFLQAADPRTSAEAAKRFDSGLPFKGESDSLLTSLDTCLATLGGDQIGETTATIGRDTTQGYTMRTPSPSDANSQIPSSVRGSSGSGPNGPTGPNFWSGDGTVGCIANYAMRSTYVACLRVADGRSVYMSHANTQMIAEVNVFSGASTDMLNVEGSSWLLAPGTSTTIRMEFGQFRCSAPNESNIICRDPSSGYGFIAGSDGVRSQ